MEPEPARERRPIGELFVERGYLSAEELSSALDEQRRSGTKLGEILVERGHISRLALAGILSEQWDADDRQVNPGPLGSLRSVGGTMESLAAVGTLRRAAACPEPVVAEADLAAAVDERLHAALAELERKLEGVAAPAGHGGRGWPVRVLGVLLLLGGFAGLTAVLWTLAPWAAALALCAGALTLGAVLLGR